MTTRMFRAICISIPMRWLSFACLLLFTQSYSQEITYVQAAITGDFVTVYYTLECSVPDQVFAIDLYSSQDGYQKPLQRVRGDVGEGVTAGEIRQIEWGINEEFTQHADTLTFEVRARQTFAPVSIRFPQALTHLQKGINYRVAWEGGLPDGTLELLLVKEDKILLPIAAVPNVGFYEWTVPRDIPEGHQYRLRIRGKGPRGDYETNSGRFAIKRKVSAHLRESN